MSAATFFQIEAIPFISLAITLILSVREIEFSRNVRRFRMLVISVMAILLVDGFNWYTVVHPSRFSPHVLWISNIVYFLLTEIIAGLWFIYVVYQINENKLTNRQKSILHLSFIPIAAVCLIIVTAPLNHLIFYLEPNTNIYHRGVLHFLQAICGFGYMLFASVLAFIKSRKATLTEQKKEYRFLCFIIILPFIGGILQTMNYYFVFLWPFSAAAAFLLHIDFQGHQISVDSLTSLNNRGALERYIQQKTKARETGWYIVMSDVDKFKQINDKYGHIEGDRALQIVAQSLKNIFGKTKAFISRYGGDEFVIISDFENPAAINNVFERCQKEIAKQLAERSLKYELYLSFGYAQYTSAHETPIESLLHAADTMMYEQKKLRARQNIIKE